VGGGFKLLHPAQMYEMFWPYWRDEVPARHVLGLHAPERRITPPALPEAGAGLPRDYVAVRFYFSQCFPDTGANRALITSVVRNLAEHTDVVLSGPAFAWTTTGNTRRAVARGCGSSRAATSRRRTSPCRRR